MSRAKINPYENHEKAKIKMSVLTTAHLRKHIFLVR